MIFALSVRFKIRYFLLFFSFEIDERATHNQRTTLRQRILTRGIETRKIIIICLMLCIGYGPSAYLWETKSIGGKRTVNYVLSVIISRQIGRHSTCYNSVRHETTITYGLCEMTWNVWCAEDAISRRLINSVGLFLFLVRFESSLLLNNILVIILSNNLEKVYYGTLWRN